MSFLLLAMREGEDAVRVQGDLVAAGHRAAVVHEWKAVLPAIRAITPQVVLLDPDLPGARSDDLEAFLRLRPRPRPAYLLVADRDPFELALLRARSEAEGAVYLRAPGEVLVAEVEELLRQAHPDSAPPARPQSLGRILLADRDPAARDQARVVLRRHAGGFDEVDDWAALGARVRQHAYRAVIFDIPLAGEPPTYPGLGSVPLAVLWSRYPRAAVEGELRRFGAVYLSKLAPAAELARRLSRITLPPGQMFELGEVARPGRVRLEGVSP